MEWSRACRWKGTGSQGLGLDSREGARSEEVSLPSGVEYGGSSLVTWASLLLVAPPTHPQWLRIR